MLFSCDKCTRVLHTYGILDRDAIVAQKKHKALQDVYKILVNIRDGDGDITDIDEAIGYLGEVLE